jgi:hypothetical protein
LSYLLGKTNGLRAAIIAALVVTLIAAIAPGSARSGGPSAPSAVSTFFVSEVYGNQGGHPPITQFQVHGISPGEGVVLACSGCGSTQFHRSNGGTDEADLTASPPLRALPQTRVIIGAVFQGLVGRWKAYRVFPSFALVGSGCTPPSLTTLSVRNAKHLSGIPKAPCPPPKPFPTGEYVFWRGSNGQLSEFVYAYGRWNSAVSIPSGQLGSPPTVAVHPQQLDVFWKAPDGQLKEMWYTGSWHGPVNLPHAGTLGSGPSDVVDARGVDHVFWRGTDGILWELSGPGRQWASASFDSGPLGSAPSAAITPAGEQDVFWRGPNRMLYEIRRTGRWRGAANLAGAGVMGSAPAAAVDAKGVDHVFWKGTDGFLWELTGAGTKWSQAAIELPSGGLGSPPAVVIRPDTEEDVFWEGGARHGLYEFWYTNGLWHGPSRRKAAGQPVSQPAVVWVP